MVKLSLRFFSGFRPKLNIELAYKIKEIYYTLQGEGYHTGQAAVFCRFTGCNLWSGREEDRYKAICKFCDTDFWGMDGELGGKYSAKKLVNTIKSLWPENNDHCFVVFTGGEPALQMDAELIEVLHDNGCEIAIETNGTIELPDGIDWVCMSPKANTEIVVTKGNELKLVYPQKGAMPNQFENLNFEHFYIQPMDGNLAKENTQKSIQFCLENPKWRLSLQTHKLIGIP